MGFAFIILIQFADAINEGSTLEEAMRHSRVATPLDWERAFGSSEGWKKIGGGKKDQALLTRFTLPDQPLFGSGELSKLKVLLANQKTAV